MASSGPDLTSRILHRERLIVASGILLLAGISWWYLATGAGMSERMDMPGMRPPLPALVLMWWLMMAAMMLPSAAPAVLLYARVRQQRRSQSAIPDTGSFLAGYLLVWLLFSIIAASAQALLTGSSMALDNSFAQGALLIAAGIYELTSLKQACLRQCQSPAQFISRHWRAGVAGAVRLGVLHGAYCVGCCWMLMTLLFVGGVMNFAWIAGLTLLVGAEKLLPRGGLIGRAAGVALIGWGVLTLAL